MDSCLAISRHSPHNIFTQNLQRLMFLIPLSTLEYPLIFEIHLMFCQKQYNSLIKTVENVHILVIYKNGKILKKGCQAHLTTPPPYGYDLSNIPAVHRDLRPVILVSSSISQSPKKDRHSLKKFLHKFVDLNS